MITALAWIGGGSLAAMVVGFSGLIAMDSIRDRKARREDGTPKGHTGVHRKGAVRKPYQRPAWATALAEPSDALTEATQAMPLVELRGEIGRHGSRQLGPVMARPDWDWMTDVWEIRNDEVFGVVDAT